MQGIDVYGVKSLRETYDFLEGKTTLSPVREDGAAFFEAHQKYEADFSEVKGQQHVKRAIEVAVAGGHNLLIL